MSAQATPEKRQQRFVLYVWHKLVLVGVIAAILCAVPTALYIRGANQEIRATLTEIAGLAPAASALRLAQLLQSHRALSSAALNGAQAQAPARHARAGEITAQLAALRSTVGVGAASAYGTADTTALLAQIDRIERGWKTLQQAVTGTTASAQDSDSQHGRLISEALALAETMIDQFGLSLDSSTHTSHLITLAFRNAPEAAELMAQMRDTGVAMLTVRQATTEERVFMATQAERAKHAFERVRVSSGKALAANGAAHPARQAITALKTADEAAYGLAQKLDAVTGLEFLRIEVLRHDAAQYAAAASAAVEAQYKVSAEAQTALANLLTERVSQRRWTMGWLLGMIGALVIGGTLLLCWFGRSIVRPLIFAMRDADAMAAGRLDKRLRNVGADEVGRVRTSMQYMQDNFINIVQAIRDNSESLASASRDIANSTRNMSERTESQAANLEETASSMENMNHAVQQNGQSIQRADELAAGAARAAGQGGEVVNKLVNTMQEIDAASKQIAEIVGVIDGIAFQTNILALNAAVEAARAGDQGRGFAVVAAEVRALAQRSGSAAKEIRTLIGDTVKKVGAGAQEAQAAGSVMQEIVAAASHVETTLRELHTSSEDQRQGIAQVSRAVEQMNQGVQQSAAMVEEIAATAEMLSNQAQDLTHAVAAFTLPDAAHELPAPHATPSGGSTVSRRAALARPVFAQ